MPLYKDVEGVIIPLRNVIKYGRKPLTNAVQVVISITTVKTMIINLEKLQFKRRGRVSFEAVLVVAVIAGLVGTLTAGVVSYRNGAARHECVKNIASVQRAVRVYQAQHHLSAGSDLQKADLIGAGKVFATEPCCPQTGDTYVWQNRIPLPGLPLIYCQHAKVQGHAPSTTADW